MCKATEGEALGHDWDDATCTTPKTCSVCKVTEGNALGHDWDDATCTAPKTCSVCKVTEGDALGHKWTAATCTDPRTCSVCSAKEGSSLGHQWTPATCTDPKTCTREGCGVTEGSALGHKWSDATCTTPKTCSVCKVTEGAAAGHKWTPATCTSPKICDTCGTSEGDALDHSYSAPTYVWGADNKTCTATKVCANDASHIITETVTASVQSTSATCTKGGETTYTATFLKEGFVAQVKTETSDKLGHDLGAVNFKWSDDASSCSAEQKCQRLGCTYSIKETATASGKITLAPTCKDPGTMRYTAKFVQFAAQTKDVVIPATGDHTVQIIDAIPSTCTVAGKTEGKKCSVCGDILVAPQDAPLAAHTYDDKYDAFCNVCNFEREAECAHTQTVALKAVAATCTTTGLTAGVKCANEKCGEIITAQTITDALGHDWADATCTEPKTCQRAGCNVTEGKELGHKWSVSYSWTGDKTTCVATKSCSACTAKITIDSVEVVTNRKDATCTEDGYTEYTATFEDESLDTQILEEKHTKLGHNLSDKKTNPTCDDRGYTTTSCSRCDYVATGSFVDALGHNYASTVTTAPTCTSTGVKTYTCQRTGCNDSYTEVISSLGHDEVSHEAKAPTCTEIGWNAYVTCSRCDYTTYSEIKANGHTVITDAEKAPTCTSTGLTEGSHCSVCNTVIVAQEVLKMLDHTYDCSVATEGYLATAATCTAKATYYKSCSCGAKGTETFESGAKAAHNFTEKTVTEGYLATAATCTAEAKYYYACSACGEKGTETYTHGAKLAHNYTAKITNIDYRVSAATCTEAAKYYYACSACSAKGTEIYTDGSALDHSFTNYVSDGDATCTADGHKTAECDRDGCSEKNTVVDTGSKLAHTYDQEVVDEKYLASSATCTVQATYYKSCKCGAFDAEESVTFESGETLAHTYKEIVLNDKSNLVSAATCTSPAVYYKACTCGDKDTENTFEYGESLGHDWVDATCTTPKTCQRANCGATEGKALDHSMTDGKCDRCPVATIEKALTLEDGTAVILTGYVMSIDSAWNEEYGNMSVTLRDESGDHTIYLYKLATKVSLGDYITVTGEKLNYNGTHEVVDGSAVIVTAHTECTPVADATCKESSVCSLCGALVAPALGHIDDNTDGKCDRNGCSTFVTVSTVWTLVTDVNDLVAGSKIILVSAGDNSYAMGPQANNNRTGVAVTKDGSIVTFVTAVQEITLEDAGDGMFAFNVGTAGYLYAASSSGNQLKTKTTLDNNGKWTVTISGGVASIEATNSNNRNVMQYNYNGGSPIFSCYASASQKGIEIYKQTTAVVESFGVTFDYNDGVTADGLEVVANGNRVTKPTDPTRAGYNFMGWFTEGDVEFDFNSAITENITLVAKWEEKVYFNVIFNSNGGSTVDTQRIEKNYTATEPTAPTRDGYDFDGWYTDAECNNEFVFSTPITAETTLYAKWISNALPEYNVTFNTNGGSAVESQVVTQGEKADRPADPTKDGHSFAGWYADADCTDEFDFNNDTITSDTVIYAKWVAVQSTTLSIQAYANANGWVNGTQYKTINVNNYITATATGSTNTGKLYDGNNWRFYQNESPTLTITAIDGCVIESITITYTISNTGTLKYNENNYASGTELTSLGAQSIEFTVGNTGSATNGQARIQSISVTYRLTKDFDEVTVSFNSNGGSAVESQTMLSGNTATQPAVPTKDGFEFAGWYSDSALTNEFNFSTPVESDITLHAKWTEKASGGPSYVKVTSAEQFTSGTYVIVIDGYVLTKYNNKWVEVNSSVSPEDPQGNVWTLTVSGSTVKIKDSSGQYLKPTANSNAIGTGEYSWNWSFSDGKFQFADSGNTVLLAANKSSGYKLRGYKNSTASGYPHSFELYKLVEN